MGFCHSPRLHPFQPIKFMEAFQVSRRDRCGQHSFSGQLASPRVSWAPAIPKRPLIRAL